jgi:hypothetical protein
MALSGDLVHGRAMDQDRRPAVLKTAQLLLVLIVTFSLGRYSIQFSGGGMSSLEWTSVILYAGCLLALLCLLVRGFWKVSA